MSAIWGIVDLYPGHTGTEKRKRGDRLREEAVEMKRAYEGCRLDDIQEALTCEYYLACGVQHVTKEAKKEKFPYGGPDQRFVADVILDNRRELLGLCSDPRMGPGSPDGEILYQSYRHCPEQTLAVALGAYVCACLEQKGRTLTLFNDAVGNRSVYYWQQEGKVYFSSLLKGIICQKRTWECNEGWFERFFSIEDLRAVSEPRETPYAGILRLEPGEKIVFSGEGMCRRSYWDPYAERKILRGKTEEEYRELVTETFRQCVEDVIREGTETGILLSGGLDSNAVAAYAAPFLAEKGKKLYSFTSVPEEQERQRIPGQYAVEDERSSVELLRKLHGNLVPEYIVTHQGDLLTENRKIQELLEIPCKAVLNLPWIAQSYRRAAEKGCGILLSGQYGNITISYGDFRCLFLTLLKKGRIPELWREMEVYRKKYHRSRKWIWKDLLTAGGQDFAEISRYMYDKNALRQMGEYEVKLSLATGVVPRDPTRDKRLIQLVLSLPVEQFTHGGQERRLVRQYLRDRIPAEILQDEFHKGRQAVGSAELLEEQWEEIRRGLPEMEQKEPVEENLSRGQMVRRFYCGLAREYQKRFEV